MKATKLVLLLHIGIMLSAAPALAGPIEDDPFPAEEQRKPTYFTRIAVAPFLVGHRQPKMDANMDDTLSCPLNQICKDDPTIAPEAGVTLTRILHGAMAARFQNHIVQPGEVRLGYGSLKLNNAKDTPRTLARQLGRAVSADIVVIGAVWRYRERAPLEGIPDMPASVAFAVYLVEAETGRRLWRGIYDGTQKYATQNIFNLSKQLKMGNRWLKASELARHGVEEALNGFPDHIKPEMKQASSQ